MSGPPLPRTSRQPIGEAGVLKAPRPRNARGALTALRSQLALLSLLATGPLILLLISGSISDRSNALDKARQQAESLAVLGAEQQDDMIQETNNLLRVLAMVSEVRDMLPGPCHALLRAVEEDHPRIGTISAVRLNGDIACNSRQEQPELNIADRPYFQRMLSGESEQVVLSEIVQSRVTGKPTIIAAVPILNAERSGAPVGVMIAALDLDWFSRLAKRLAGAAAHLVQIVDARSGSVLARSSDGQGAITQHATDRSLMDAVRVQPGGGSLLAPGTDGIERITGFAPLPGTQARLVLTVGFSRAEVLGQANRHLLVDIAAAFTVTVTAFVLAWVVANRSVLQPVQRLAGVAARLGRGELGVRAGALPAAARELQALAETFDDMTQRLQAREAELSAIQASLASSEEHHRLLSTNATDMITRFDANFHYTYVSPACREVIGYEPEELIGQYPGGIVHPDDLQWVETTLRVPLKVGLETARATYRAIRKDGRHVWLESGGRRLADGNGFVVVTRDVTTRKEMEQQLEEANRLLRGQAMQDPLTGLANRRQFDEMLGNEFRRVQRLQLPLGVIMLDIDHFKLFNDTYGHPAGDACINAVAAAVDSVLRRPGDLAGRYGGEEFAILLPGTDSAGAATMGERIRTAVESLGLAHSAASRGIVTVSVGAAVIMPPIGAVGPAAFMEAADAALYEAKRAGRNAVRVTSWVRPLSEIGSLDDFGAA